MKSPTKGADGQVKPTQTGFRMKTAIHAGFTQKVTQDSVGHLTRGGSESGKDGMTE